LEKAIKVITLLKRERSTVVFTNGCFDILHKGHIEYLRQSRLLGDCLVIGLNSDASVKRLKGNDRPINSEQDRALVLEALDFVDYIVVFNEDTPLNLIMSLKPIIYTKAGEYSLDNVIGKGLGKDIIEAYGGRVKLIPLISGISSTEIIRRRSVNE
jgi:D-beta-D-heptose 7-phosphate kinase/D-beta-D-heptose 1-phosphate adenosyltransferase